MTIPGYIILSLIVLGGFYGLGLAIVLRRFNKNDQRTTVILTGGGTGGHVYPLLAILEEIQRRHPNYNYIYIGKAGKAEDHIIPEKGITLIHTWAYPFEGVRNPLKIVLCGIVTALGTFKSLWYIIKYAPLWIISTGGYVSVPTILAGIIVRRFFLVSLGIYLHEQNTVPGRANFTVGKWVDHVFVSFPQTLRFFPINGVISGYPVRRSIYHPKNRRDPVTSMPFKIPPGRKVVFVFGGSQGARSINRGLIQALPYLFLYRHNIFIIHGRGLAKSDIYNAEKDTEEFIKNLSPEIRDSLNEFYYAQDYFYNIDMIYAASHLIVARSGAGTISEIAASGKPSILIPKTGLPGDHQVMNARVMQQAGAAQVIYEVFTKNEKGELIDHVDGQTLAQRILRLLQDDATLLEMSTRATAFFRQNSSKIIVDVIEQRLSPPKPEEVLKSLEVPRTWTNGSLLRSLQAEYGKNPKVYSPLNLLKDEEELEYFRYRANRLLVDNSWEVRNLGVKLVGYLLYREKVPELLKMIDDKRLAPFWQRLLGGDYIEVGFIRRNALTSLRILDFMDKSVETILLGALKDPYYEVRAEACRVVTHFAYKLAGKELWFDQLSKALKDKSFEVVAEAAVALGNIGIDQRALDALFRLGRHHFWQVREAALKGILTLLERYVICPSKDFYAGLNNFILTSTDFTPNFTIREVYQRIIELCDERINKKECPGLEEVKPFHRSS